MACAVKLAEKGIPFQILEASDGVGGRVRTDVVDGFLLDRGFQIFLTSYPEAQRLLDYRCCSTSSLPQWGFRRIAEPSATRATSR